MPELAILAVTVARNLQSAMEDAAQPKGIRWTLIFLSKAMMIALHPSDHALKHQLDLATLLNPQNYLSESVQVGEREIQKTPGAP